MQKTRPSIDEFPLHERELLRSARLGYVSAMSFVKRGWKLRKLKTPYCSAGGSGRYSHCMYDGDRGLIQITDTIVEQVREALEGQVPGDEQTEPLALDTTMLLLDFPDHARQQVKDAGGVWLPMFKHWGCMPMEAEKFASWLMHPRVAVRSVDDLVRLKVSRIDANRAKAAGAFWSDGPCGSGWFGLRALSGRLSEWL